MIETRYFNKLIKESKNVVESFGYTIPSSIDFKIKDLGRSWGRCTYHKSNIEIDIDKRLLESCEDLSIKNTIIHELLHACFPGDHHLRRWRDAANKITRNTEYTIKRITNADEKNFEPKDFMFKIVCTGCGKKWFYFKQSKKIRPIIKGGYHCPYCKTKKFDVYNKFGELIK